MQLVLEKEVKLTITNKGNWKWATLDWDICGFTSNSEYLIALLSDFHAVQRQTLKLHWTSNGLIL